jgi:hypothetical protein
MKNDYGTLRYMSPYNVFGPKYRSTLDKRIECERRLIPSTHIESEYSIYNLKVDTKDIEEKGAYVDDRDWDAIKENLPFFSNADGRDLFEDNVYNIKDKMLEVFEVRTDNSLSIWINSRYQGTFPALGPLKKINSYGVQFKKVPGMSR